MTDLDNRSAKTELASLTSQIVASYVGRNSLPLGDLPGLIHTVYQSLANLGAAALPATGQEPAVPVKKSVMPEYIICLEDGKTFKSLKRHLRTQYGLTPEAYREKWGLPADYPMVAPNYAKARSQLAKEMGLGQQRRRKR